MFAPNVVLILQPSSYIGYIGQIVPPPLTPAKPWASALTKKIELGLNQVKPRFCNFQ